MMKAAILLFVVAVLAGGQTAVLDTAHSRGNMQEGVINPGDRLLQSGTLLRQARPNMTQHADFIHRFAAWNRISAVTATELGIPQNATAWIYQGGPGANHVYLRAMSAVGGGFHYRIQVWGR